VVEHILEEVARILAVVEHNLEEEEAGNLEEVHTLVVEHTQVAEHTQAGKGVVVRVLLSWSSAAPRN
jgi:hypothetical protein